MHWGCGMENLIKLDCDGHCTTIKVINSLSTLKKKSYRLHLQNERSLLKINLRSNFFFLSHLLCPNVKIIKTIKNY